MNGPGALAVATPVTGSDAELVAAVRAGDDGAFEELYRRYERRIAAFVRGMLRDEARAEDVTQEAFFSALRRLRATDAEIVFKPWIYEIARNGAIDAHRRTSRAEEVSINTDELLRPGDRGRLVGSTAPESALIQKEQLEHLRGAFDELPETHHRILVMRELEGLSYREIGARLELTRPAVESALFRARRRLEREYEELDTGRRCEAMRAVIYRMAEGVESEADAGRLRRHARRCVLCRRLARQLDVEPLERRGIAARAAALLPLPAFLRRRLSGAASGGAASGGAGHATGTLGGLLGSGGPLTAALGEKAAVIVAAAALAGAGGAVLGGVGPLDLPGGGDRQGAEHRGGEGSAAPGGRSTAGRDGTSVAGPGSSLDGSRAEGAAPSGDRSTSGRPGAEAGEGASGADGDARPDAQLVPDLPVPSPGLPSLPSAPSAPSVDNPAAPAGDSSGQPEVPRMQVPLNSGVPEAPAPPSVPEGIGGSDLPRTLGTPPDAGLPNPRVDNPLGGTPRVP